MIEHIETKQIVSYLSGGYMMHLETTRYVSHVTCQVSHVTLQSLTCIHYTLCVLCHMSGVTNHLSCVMCYIFFTKWLSWFVETLLSIGPTLSSFLNFSYYKRIDAKYLLISACSSPFWVFKKANLSEFSFRKIVIV